MKMPLLLAVVSLGCASSSSVPPAQFGILRGIPIKNFMHCVDLVSQELPDVTEGLKLSNQQLRCAQAISLRHCGNMYTQAARESEKKGGAPLGPDWCSADWVKDSGDMVRRECGESLLDPLPHEVAGEVFRAILDKVLRAAPYQ